MESCFHCQQINPNEAVFAYLRGHGFTLPVIRWALMDLNDITLGRLTGGELSIATASNTVAGRRRNEVVIEILAAELGIPARILFPVEG